MRIVVAKNYEDMSSKAARIIASQLILKPASTLGLATGETPLGTYKNLIEMHRAGEIDFNEVSTYNLDEYRGLSHDHVQSYHYFMRKNLFDHVNIDLANTHIPDGQDPDSEIACAQYDELLKASGGCDIQLLGIGNNGHIGFNEPSDAFEPNTFCVDLTESTIEANSRLFESKDDVPRQAYTMGIGSIMSAKMILVVVSGKAKAQAVQAMIEGPISPRCPASILQLHQNCVVVADEDALSLCI